MEELIGSYAQEYQHYIALAFALILMIGSIRNWNWLCDPIGKPDYLWLTRKLLRLIFFILGLILLVCEISLILI